MKKTFNLLSESDWDPFLDYLLNLRGKARLTVTVQKYRKKRSKDANRYYFGCVVKGLSDYTGYTEAEMHDEILGTYVGWETRVVNGHSRDYPRRRSTTPDVMETMDFQGLIMTGQRMAAELGVRLPDQEREETDPRNQDAA